MAKMCNFYVTYNMCVPYGNIIIGLPVPAKIRSERLFWWTQVSRLRSRLLVSRETM